MTRFGEPGDDLPGQAHMPYQPDRLQEHPPELVRFVISLSQKVTQDALLGNPDVEAIADIMYAQYLIAFQGWLYGEELQRQEIRYPKDWWQALKARFFPTWLLARYPAQETVTVLEVRALYPELHRKLQLPDQDHQIHILRKDHDDPDGK